MPVPSHPSVPSVPNFRSYLPLSAPLALPHMQAPLSRTWMWTSFDTSHHRHNRTHHRSLTYLKPLRTTSLLVCKLCQWKDVEATLSNQYRRSDPDCLLLAYLRAPGDGTTQVQAAALILEELIDSIEDISTTTSLVVRYVQAQRRWTDRFNSAVNSLETLLGTVDSIQ
jgi:hypothetical protein